MSTVIDGSGRKERNSALLHLDSDLLCVSMASTEGLVPITRAFLCKFYDKYPFPPSSPDVNRLTLQLRNTYAQLARPDDKLMIAQMEGPAPHKIDENLWRNSEHIEEILYLLDRTNWPMKFKSKAVSEDVAIFRTIEQIATEMNDLLKVVQAFQSASMEKIFNMVVTYMPQDFRGTLLKQQRERSEKKRQAEIEALVSSGGSIHEKYSLLWKQQMERRRQLAQIGNATGVYKTLVKYLVGVPEVLLDFVRQINDHNGPMEEQRQRYGPPVYELTNMATAIHICLRLWWKHFDESSLSTESMISLMQQSTNTYYLELKKFLSFFRDLFNNSPFLISAEEAGGAEPSKLDDVKEATIIAGKMLEVLLPVDSDNTYIVWDFKLTSGKDVGFSLELIREHGEKRLIVPYQRLDSDKGSFCAPVAGSYKLIWDNSYSTFYKKILRYKVEIIPPVIETLQPDAHDDGDGDEEQSH